MFHAPTTSLRLGMCHRWSDLPAVSSTTPSRHVRLSITVYRIFPIFPQWKSRLQLFPRWSLLVLRLRLQSQMPFLQRGDSHHKTLMGITQEAKRSMPSRHDPTLNRHPPCHIWAVVYAHHLSAPSTPLAMTHQAKV